MQFSSLLVAAAAFALANAAKFTNPNLNGVTAGKAFNVTWTDASGPVTLTLKNGDPNALKTVSVIASGLTGTSYSWSVPATLAADTYALQIDDSTGPNYSIQFQLIGGVTASSTSTTSSNSTRTASSSSTTGSSNATTTGSTTRGTSTASRTSAGTVSSTGTPTSAPNAGMAAGLTSNLAFVFLAIGAFMTLN